MMHCLSFFPCLQGSSIDPTVRGERIPEVLVQTINQGLEYEGVLPLSSDYWAEAINAGSDDQPLHLYGSRAVGYFQLWQGTDPQESYRDYLTRTVNPSTLQGLKKISNVRYLRTDEERAPYQAHFIKGKLVNDNKEVLNGELMFVLSPDGNSLYVGPKDKGSFHHSSFFAGGAVKSAGLLNVVDGKITCIYYRSGHYKPSQRHAQYLIDFLAEKERLGDAAHSIPISGFPGGLLKCILDHLNYYWRCLFISW